MPKDKLSYEEQIEHLKKKGIQFQRMSEEDALLYLKHNSYLFKVRAYRKNYPKDVTGCQYLHLDFASLVDLAVIDMQLRSLLIKLALNIEHFAKVRLLHRITSDPAEDGYSIVADCLASLDDSTFKIVSGELKRNARSPYCSAVYHKYKGHFPVWVFVEIIPFGSFLSFYKFCANRFAQRTATGSDKAQYKADRNMLNDFYLMLPVKRIRNAAAHNNCILNDLYVKGSKKDVSYELTRALRNDLGVGSGSIQKKISNIRISQILTCLYMHKKIVSSPDVSRFISKNLHRFCERLFLRDNYNDNNLIRSTFKLFITAIDKWYPLV